MRAEMNDETNMPRVAVMPMKIPSQIKATQPAAGISHAHQRKSPVASTTWGSSVNNLTIQCPPIIYNKV